VFDWDFWIEFFNWNRAGTLKTAFKNYCDTLSFDSDPSPDGFHHYLLTTYFQNYILPPGRHNRTCIQKQSQKIRKTKIISQDALRKFKYDILFHELARHYIYEQVNEPISMDDLDKAVNHLLDTGENLSAGLIKILNDFLVSRGKQGMTYEQLRSLLSRQSGSLTTEEQDVLKLILDNRSDLLGKRGKLYEYWKDEIQPKLPQITRRLPQITMRPPRRVDQDAQDADLISAIDRAIVAMHLMPQKPLIDKLLIVLRVARSIIQDIPNKRSRKSKFIRRLLINHLIFLHNDNLNTVGFDENINHIIALIRHMTTVPRQRLQQALQSVDLTACLDNNVQSMFTMTLNFTVDKVKPFLQVLGEILLIVMNKGCQNNKITKIHLLDLMKQDDNMRRVVDILNDDPAYRQKAFDEIKIYGVFTQEGQLSSNATSINDVISGLLEVCYKLNYEEGQQIDC
jgi:hypothetical protein